MKTPRNPYPNTPDEQAEIDLLIADAKQRGVYDDLTPEIAEFRTHLRRIGVVMYEYHQKTGDENTLPFLAMVERMLS